MNSYIKYIVEYFFLLEYLGVQVVLGIILLVKIPVLTTSPGIEVTPRIEPTAYGSSRRGVSKVWFCNTQGTYTAVFNSNRAWSFWCSHLFLLLFFDIIILSIFKFFFSLFISRLFFSSNSCVFSVGFDRTRAWMTSARRWRRGGKLG